MIEKYAKNIDIHNHSKSEFTWINPFIKGTLIECAYEVTFICLYPRMLLKLKENGFLTHVKLDSEVFDRLQYYIDNKNALLLEDAKLEDPLKSYISGILNRIGDKNSQLLISLISQYMHQYYTDLIKANEHRILYIDTDLVYFTDNNYNLLDINLPYETDVIEMAIFEDRGKYTYLSEEDIRKRGLDKTKGISIREITQLIKTGLRNNKIDDVFK